LAGHPACGDIMKLQIEVGEDGKTIEKAVFKVRSSFDLIIKLNRLMAVVLLLQVVNMQPNFFKE